MNYTKKKITPLDLSLADEAQYLKIIILKMQKAIKQIKSDTRFALTGTPIENSFAELWSIFDFVMPGYLFSYKNLNQPMKLPIVKKDNDEDAMKKIKNAYRTICFKKN